MSSQILLKKKGLLNKFFEEIKTKKNLIQNNCSNYIHDKKVQVHCKNRNETKRKCKPIDSNDTKRLRLQDDKENAKHSNDEDVAETLDFDNTGPETLPLSLNNTPFVE